MLDYSDLDAARVYAPLPEGLPPGSDAGAIATGIVVAVDSAARMVQVRVADSDPFWIPAVAGIYTSDIRVRVLKAPLDGGRAVLCEGPIDPVPDIVAGRITAVNASVGTLTVTATAASWELPYAPGTYSVGNLVHVLRSPALLGDPIFVLGLQGNYSGADPGGAATAGGNDPVSVLRERVIAPQWSGSWKSAQGRWDSWNPDRYGGISTLWQGDAYGSGPMTGLAVYGDQIVNLNAVEITSMRATLRRADSSVSSARTPVLQPAADGVKPGGAPTLGGGLSSGPGLVPEQGADVYLVGSVLEGFRTGAYRGLATVGTDYGGFYGTARGDGMLLVVQYRVVE